MHHPGERSKTGRGRGNVLRVGPTGRTGPQIDKATNTKEPDAREPSARYAEGGAPGRRHNGAQGVELGKDADRILETTFQHIRTEPEGGTNWGHQDDTNSRVGSTRSTERRACCARLSSRATRAVEAFRQRPRSHERSKER